MPAKPRLKFIPNPVAPKHPGVGRCHGQDPELFFREDKDGIAFAKKICSDCPLAAKCLEYAVVKEEFGIWGGKTAEERNRIRGWKLPDAELLERSNRAIALFSAGHTVAYIAEYFSVVERTVYRFKADWDQYDPNPPTPTAQPVRTEPDAA